MTLSCSELIACSGHTGFAQFMAVLYTAPCYKLSIALYIILLFMLELRRETLR